MAVASLLSIIGMSPVFVSAPFSLKIRVSVSAAGPQVLRLPPLFQGFVTGILVLVGIVAVIGGALFLIFSIGYVVPGYRMVNAGSENRYNLQYKLLSVGLPLTGVVEIIIGAAIASLGTGHIFGSVLQQGILEYTVLLSILAAVLFVFRLVGYLGAGLFLIQLYNRHNDALLLATGILFIVAIPLPLIGFIAWVLSAIAARQLMEGISQSSGQKPRLLIPRETYDGRGISGSEGFVAVLHCVKRRV